MFQSQFHGCLYCVHIMVFKYFYVTGRIQVESKINTQTIKTRYVTRIVTSSYRKKENCENNQSNKNVYIFLPPLMVA